MSAISWRPIDDIPEDLVTYHNPDLVPLALAWEERLQQLSDSRKLKEFNEKLSRQWAIETGIIERVYTLDRGVTQMLIERGVEASLIPHGTSNKPAQLVVSIIQDQQEVIEGLYDYIAHRRDLTTSYIKQMHQVFMRNQATTEGLDEFGNLIEIEVIRGDWKKWPNNPRRSNGTIHLYCPPEQVASEMDRLVSLHQQHLREGISPEIEAAWLHHRFTQIHPFQDGNGRVARTLASLVFIRNKWFPLVIINEIRDEYIRASEQADQGDLTPMVDLFARRQIHAFRQALSISEDVTAQRSLQVIINQSLERLRQRREPHSVIELSNHLESVGMERLQDIALELTNALHQVEPTYSATASRSDSTSDYWFKGQIIQLAKKFEYYANFRYYSTWLRLRIQEQRLTNLVFSFHGLGYEFSGIMAVSAFLEFRSISDTEDTMPEGPYPVCMNIFQFSFRETTAQVEQRFIPWLEETLLIALEQWRKQL